MTSAHQTLALSDIDSMFLGRQPVPIQMVFFYPQGLDTLLLEKSLNEILPDYWPLVGTLQMPRSSTERQVPSVIGKKLLPHVALRKNSAPDFHWSNTMDLNQLGKLALTPHFGRPSENEELLFSAQVTSISGGYLLGISMSHALADGYSFFFFLDQWSKKYRGEETRRPSHHRLLHTGSAEKKIDLDQIPIQDFIEATGFFFDPKKTPPPPEQDPFLNPNTRFDWEVLEISEAELTSITQELCPEDGIRRSPNDILCEHLYRTFGPDKGFLTVPVDVRRLSPRLQETKGTYFGNGIRPVTLAVDQAEPKGHISKRVGAEVRKLRSEKIESTLNFLAALKTEVGTAPYQRFMVMAPGQGLLVTNLSRLPLKTLMFGNSSPGDLRILTPMVGAAVILPRETGALIQISRDVLT